MRLIIDQDEVLVMTVHEWIRRYNDRYNDNLSLNEINNWDVHQFVKPLVIDEDGSESGCGKKVYSILNEPGFFLSLKPVPGAVDGMRKLIQDGHDVIIATATPTESRIAYNEKIGWIKKHLPFFDLRNFASIHRKDILRGDIMFDDAPHNLRKFDGISVAMKKPWNVSDERCSRYSVDSWKAFTDLVDSIQLDALPSVRRLTSQVRKS